jgi:hypothetical protein
VRSAAHAHSPAPARRRRLLAGALAVTGALAAWPAAAWPDDHPGRGRLPRPVTLPATDVTFQSATLNAALRPDDAARVHFEYGPGPTIAYVQRTDDIVVREDDAVDDDVPQAIAATVTGLASNTEYHFRVVATDEHGTGVGADQAFTTLAAPVTTPPAPLVAPTPAPPLAPPPPTPDLGRTVVVSEISGSVSVQPGGSGAFVPLGAAAVEVPVGSVVNATRGTLRLRSARDAAGRTQTARFFGTVFRVAQSRSGRGFTDLRIVGGRPPGCRPAFAASGRAAVVQRRRRRARRNLWARDRGGRFRTHGRNSVATVRGTTWLTSERCAGTLVRVTKGAVRVRDLRRRRTVTVRAGHRYLARDRARPRRR